MEESTVQTPKNRSLYLGMAVVLILILSYAAWGLIGNRALSKTNLEVSNLTISKDSLTANGITTSSVDITLTNLETGSFASNIWVGLKVVDAEMTSEDFSYFGWYSPSPNRAFYQTDLNGKVNFKIKSKIAGDITYAVFAADPEQRNNGKYLSLDKEFTLSFN